MKEVIRGTQRLQDLLPAFLGELREVSPEAYEQLLALPFSYIPNYATEDEDSEWWDSEEAYDKLAELTAVLDENAPEGHYFGCHSADTSCYGFWLVD